MSVCVYKQTSRQD